MFTTSREHLTVALLLDTQQNIKQDSRNVTLVGIWFDLIDLVGLLLLQRQNVRIMCRRFVQHHCVQSMILDNLQNDINTLKKVNLNSHWTSIVKKMLSTWLSTWHHLILYFQGFCSGRQRRHQDWSDSRSTAVGNFMASGENIPTPQLQWTQFCIHTVQSLRP